MKNVPYKENYSLAELTSLKIGGQAKVVYFPENEDQLIEIVSWLYSNHIKYIVLGGGCNILAPDDASRLTVLCTKELKGHSLDPKYNTLTCLAGTLAGEAALTALIYKMSGLAFMHKLPGTVGGACWMNAKAYDSSQQDVIEGVECLDEMGNKHYLSNSDCKFGYKESIFQRNKWIISKVKYNLTSVDPAILKKEMDEIANKRDIENQFEWPTCGCAFLNDYNLGKSSGQIIDECGLKGHEIGGAAVSDYHANFIINKGNATAQNVLDLIEHIKKVVWEKKKIKLELELQIIKSTL